jgi:hypothetical protein
MFWSLSCSQRHIHSQDLLTQTKKPGFYAFLHAVTKFSQKNPVSDYPCVIPICSLTGQFIVAKYHLTEVANFLTEEK